MDDKITDELELVITRAARIPELARDVVDTTHDPERAYGVLRDALGTLEVLTVYLEVELEREQ